MLHIMMKEVTLSLLLYIGVVGQVKRSRSAYYMTASGFMLKAGKVYTLALSTALTGSYFHAEICKSFNFDCTLRKDITSFRWDMLPLSLMTVCRF